MSWPTAKPLPSPTMSAGRTVPTQLSTGITLVALTLGFGNIAFWWGGMQGRTWQIGLLFVGLIGVVFWTWMRHEHLSPPIDPWLRWLLLLLPAYVVFQAVPLPLWLVRVLSPARAELSDGMAKVFGGSGWATLSVIPGETVFQLLGVVSALLVWLVVRELSWRCSNQPWLLVIPPLVVATLEAVLGLVQVAEGAMGTVAEGTYANRNHFAGLLEMSLPFAVMTGVAFFQRARTFNEFTAALAGLQACALLVATLMFVAILYSLSRMGFVAALFALLLMGTLAWGSRLTAGKRWVGVAVIGSSIVLGFVFLSPDPLIFRFAEINAGDEVTAYDRALMWKETLPLIAAYPIFGCGLVGYESTFPRFNVTSQSHTVDYAHNDYLQVLAELGLVGSVLVGVLVVGLLSRTLRIACSRYSNLDRWALALACSGALGAILLHSFVDFNLYVPANAMLLAWIGGIVSGLEFF